MLCDQFAKVFYNSLAPSRLRWTCVEEIDGWMSREFLTEMQNVQVNIIKLSETDEFSCDMPSSGQGFLPYSFQRPPKQQDMIWAMDVVEFIQPTTPQLYVDSSRIRTNITSSSTHVQHQC
jgi:hypothetical protein